MINFVEGEKVLYEVRRHWYMLLMDSFIAIALFLIPWIAIFGIDALNVELSSNESALLFFFAILWLFITWIVFIVIWTNYYLDVWIITNKRLIDVEQIGLFNRDFSEFRLDRIQDVTIEVNGILPTLLHFGNVHIQTAGEAREFSIKGIPDPYRFRDILVKEHDRVSEDGAGGSGV